MNDWELLLELVVSTCIGVAVLIFAGLRYMKDESKGTWGERKMVFATYLFSASVVMGGAVYFWYSVLRR